MRGTGVFAKEGDFDKLMSFARTGWMPGDRIMVFSVGEGVKKDQATMDAKKMCHKLALVYGLPEITGYYGIKEDREFVTI